MVQIVRRSCRAESGVCQEDGDRERQVHGILRNAARVVPSAEDHPQVRTAGCHVCLDYVANLADVSSGSVGSPDGWSQSL